ncbi:hypothetical protein BKA58DRAFT_435036 [Alternaria rosae]|uniref:uncharacterized protein n=1 Tax=Alternaria rosae TaxID=1187941 RepID=UPI001E8E9F82|nr:uncharacterized protein BKA58DRAFT_435036 [Alternaria rosae]KAH6883291.1 hypothetical protein BKA58DRAFT_435036 [Alternaria rosae]
MASDLWYQFVKTLSDEREDAKHVTIRLYVALDQINTIRDRFVIKKVTMNDKAVFNERTAVCRIIDTLPNSVAILKSRFWSFHDHGEGSGFTSTHRYEVERYVDYCSAGTLSSIIEHYKVIYNLTSGLTYTSGIPDTAEALGWIPKVHRDIKPSNIFLMEPQESFSSFPRPVLADLDDMLELFGYE